MRQTSYDATWPHGANQDASSVTGSVVVGEEARKTIDGCLWQPQYFAHIANRRARPIADEVGHHRCVVAAVFFIDVLDHFLATVMFDVEVDVGGLSALARDEALEEEPHAYRIDGGDAEAEAHRRVSGGAASLAQDALFERFISRERAR